MKGIESFGVARFVVRLLLLLDVCVCRVCVYACVAFSVVCALQLLSLIIAFLCFGRIVDWLLLLLLLLSAALSPNIVCIVSLPLLLLF